jgi:hypothetical protein
MISVSAHRARHTAEVISTPIGVLQANLGPDVDFL